MTAAGVAGKVFGASAAASSSPRSSSPPAKLSSLSDYFFSCRKESKSALIPSCLTAAVPSCPYSASPRYSHQVALVPSSLYSLSHPTGSHSFFTGSRDFKRVGIAVGLSGSFIWDLRRAGMRRKGSRAAGMKVRSMAGRPGGNLRDLIERKNSSNAAVVYSKSWCPYCRMVKDLFSELGVTFELVELDHLVDEQDVQEELRGLTGQSTVPNVFIGGKHIGGCDDTMALHKRGELIPALKAAGAKFTAA